MSDRHHRTIPPELDGARLDVALSRLITTHTRSFLARCIDDGQVSVDGTAVHRSAERVHTGQAVVLTLPAPVPTGVAPQDLPIPIVYQDADLAVVDKPAGLVVHPAAGHADGTLVNALLFHLSDLSGLGGEIRPGIVHRLDKDTSGLMVVAKHDAAHRFLTGHWQTGSVVKEYLALVYGTPRENEGTVTEPIGRDPRDRKRMAVAEGGRAAVTHWKVEAALRYVSLIRCRLETGRTHQIRVHMKWIGHPIVGDPVYSGPQWRGVPDKILQKALSSLERQALHAARLVFPHPTSGETLEFASQLPEDLSTLVDALRG